eukprot:m.56954 g.56954  ORF g.56954 m.56954 type:complete len:143 (+) comp11069_c0_seq1:423-851(+)
MMAGDTETSDRECNSADNMKRDQDSKTAKSVPKNPESEEKPKAGKNVWLEARLTHLENAQEETLNQLNKLAIRFQTINRRTRNIARSQTPEHKPKGNLKSPESKKDMKRRVSWSSFVQVKEFVRSEKRLKKWKLQRLKHLKP